MHWKLPEPRLKYLQEERQWKNLTRSYLACVSFVDSQVGRVLTSLKNNEYGENTIVVIWSDHGWHIGEKLITGKNTLWEDGTRVPLIFAGPGIAQGRCTKPAELLDMYPTLLDLCGLPSNNKLEGHSLIPQLQDANAVRKWPAITTHNHDNHAIRTEHWRYIQYADGSQELYDTRKDPQEWTNIAGDKKFAAIIEEHKQWIPKVNLKPVPGSRARILLYDKDNGKVNWETLDVDPNEPIPEI